MPKLDAEQKLPFARPHGGRLNTLKASARRFSVVLIPPRALRHPVQSALLPTTTRQSQMPPRLLPRCSQIPLEARIVHHVPEDRVHQPTARPRVLPPVEHLRADGGPSRPGTRTTKRRHRSPPAHPYPRAWQSCAATSPPHVRSADARLCAGRRPRSSHIPRPPRTGGCSCGLPRSGRNRRRLSPEAGLY